jgi:hypothetical protein
MKLNVPQSIMTRAKSNHQVGAAGGLGGHRKTVFSFA